MKSSALASLLAALSLLAPLVHAADEVVLQGLVTTKDDGLPFPGATVAVPSLRLSSTSDAEGTYRLVLPGDAVGKTYEVRVSASGFVPKTWPIRVAAGVLNHDFALSLTFSEEITVGSRALGVEAEKAVPVDIITAQQIESIGLAETMQVIQRLAPSFNFPRTTIADGSASVRPATLRGLGPDQVLVLVNGKRRHTTALVHVNGTVGRGSTGVDLNAIPLAAIERIEILRDGAAAQYGSDAIAGVINIVLKSGASPLTLSAQAGTTATDQGVGESASDGEFFDGSATWGGRIGQGWVSLAAEYRDRQGTNRAGPDPRDQIRAGDGGNNAVPQPNHWVGDPDTRDLLTFLNAQFPLNQEGTAFVYAFGGLSMRDATAPGFFRRSLDARNWPQIYPLGFLPLIATDVNDGSGTLGVRGEKSRWFWDVSAQYGRNSMDFAVNDSLNASLGPSVPPNQTAFYAGTYVGDALLINADVSRPFEVGLAGPLNLAFGAEFRREGYRILPGETNAYVDGGVRAQDGSRAAAGAQVFPGLKPTNATDVSRNNFALYLDLEGDVAKPLRVGVAGRFEHYGDFGSNLDGKITLRIEPTPRFVLRGAFSTGFRAPSLAQSYWTATSTNFINLGQGLVPVEVGTFPVNSALAVALGATPLRPEDSIHASGGFVLKALDNLDITADYYYIKIDDRIVFSGNFTGARVQPILNPFGVSGARFFTNAINTETNGIDVVASYRANLGGGGNLHLSAGFNHTKNKIVGAIVTPPQLAGLESVLFDRVEAGRIECGQPQDNLRFGADWQGKKLGANVRLNRFGEYCLRQLNPTGADDQIFSPKWLSDLDLAFRHKSFTATLGVQNLFDVYPEVQLVQNSISGIVRYTTIVPFGINGRTLYLRLRYRF